MGALQLMGLTWQAFSDLLDVFAPLLSAKWSRHPRVDGRGRPRLLREADVLGLMLAWIHVPSYHVILMLVFGLSPASLSSYLKEGLLCLLSAFRQHPAAHIKWPLVDEMQHLSGLIQQGQQELQGVFGFVDGLNLAMFEPPYCPLQNVYYNGWLGGCFCS